MTNFFKKNSLWVSPVIRYLITFIFVTLFSLLYFFWPHYSIFLYLVLVILFLGYFLPEAYKLLFKVNSYQGERREELNALVSGLNCKIKDFYFKVSTKHGAFALGFPAKRYIAFHSVTLEKCSWEEIEGVVAHEVGHHVNNDTLIFGTFGTGTLLISAWLSNALLATHNLLNLFFIDVGISLVVLLLGSYVSRWREHRADVFAKNHLQNTNGLADFLERVIKEYKEEGYNSTEFRSSLNFISIHPSIEERVKYLRSGK